MAFVIQWLWCLLAFVVGSAAAWLLAIATIRRTTAEAAVADLPEPREIGG